MRWKWYTEKYIMLLEMRFDHEKKCVELEARYIQPLHSQISRTLPSMDRTTKVIQIEPFEILSNLKFWEIHDCILNSPPIFGLSSNCALCVIQVIRANEINATCERNFARLFLKWDYDGFSLSDYTSLCRISRGLEATRLCVITLIPHWNWIGKNPGLNPDALRIL